MDLTAAGFSDGTGSDKTNMKLSRQRAEALKSVVLAALKDDKVSGVAVKVEAHGAEGAQKGQDEQKLRHATLVAPH